METKPKLNIQGTFPSTYNAQLLASTGIPILDELLGGGVPAGSLILIEDDTYGNYSKTMLKYFVAEGIVNRHGCLIASLDCDPNVDIAQQLPAANDIDAEVEMQKSLAKKDDSQMTIAFRYQHLPTTERTVKSRFGHYFNLSHKMTPEQLNVCDVRYFSGCENSNSGLLKSEHLNGLLSTVSNIINDERYSLDDKLDIKNMFRFCIYKLGSPLWACEEDLDDVRKFIFYLRCLIRKSFGIAVVTIPTYFSNKLKNMYTTRLTHISDIAISLQAFAGTKMEKNKALSEFHGFFFITKLAAINSLTSKHPGPVEYVFKQRRKKFAIEILHLPPDIQDTNKDSEKTKTPSVGCGSSSKHLLEF